MEDSIKELLEIAESCKKAAEEFSKQGFDKELTCLEDVIRKVERASANSWLGYQANVYYIGFNIPQPGDHFSKEWGFQGDFINPVSKNWREYSPEAVREYIFEQSGVDENSKLVDVASDSSKIFQVNKDKLVTLLTVLLEETKSESVEGYRDEAKKLESHHSQSKLMQVFQPKGQFISRDSIAMSQGFIAPPHVGVKCWLYSLRSYFLQLEELAKTAERAATYLRQKYRKTVPEKIIEGKVFIGHGRSLLWRDLSHFLSERLKLNNCS